MENKNNEMVYVTVYADNTGLFTEQECECCNIVDLIVPYWITKEWYMTNEKEYKETTMDELRISEEEATFEKWFNSVCVCEDFDGFYDYCIIKGVVPNLLEEEYNTKRYKICYEKPENNKDLFSETSVHVLFEGTSDECRRYGRFMKWKYANFESEIGEWKKYNLYLDSCF